MSLTDIVHSDIKPANFILVKGIVKMIDFGIAKTIQSDRTSVTRHEIVGTFNYMSPEAVNDLNNCSSPGAFNTTDRNLKVLLTDGQYHS